MREHGTRAKYYAERCRCDLCRRACADYEHQRQQRIFHESIGVTPPKWIDIQPCRDHIIWLRSQGMGLARIAEVSGVSPSTVQSLAGQPSAKPTKRVRRDIAEKILATRPDPAGKALVDAGAAQRKLQALVALGWTQGSIGARIGVSASNMTATITGQPQMTARRVRAIGRVYAELHMTPGPSVRARNDARRKGWLPPLAWDDIDAGTLADGAYGGCLTCADIAHLLDAGETPEAIAARMSLQGKGSLDTHLRRHGRTDLLDRIKARRAA